MASMVNKRKITDNMVKGYLGKPRDREVIIRDTELTGFAFRVTKKGTISFIVEARIRGKGGSAKRMTVGRYPAHSVIKARELARENLQAFYEGEDPKTRKKAAIDIETERDSYTLQFILDEYIQRRDLKPKTVQDYRNLTRLVYGDWLPKPIHLITRKMVEERFFEHKKSVAIYSSRILSGLLNYAKAIELSDQESRLITENPVEVLKDKKINRSLDRRQTAVQPGELKKILVNLEGVLKNGWHRHYNRSVISALYIIALTGCRKNEILNLQKEDVKLPQNYFLIKDTKNGREHIVPITEEIRWVIDLEMKLNKKSRWLFPSDRLKDSPVSNPDKAVKQFLKGYTLHDFRRTFITVASELGMDHHSIKAMVNHKSSDVTDGYIVTRIEQRLPMLIELYTKIQNEMMNRSFAIKPQE